MTWPPWGEQQAAWPRSIAREMLGVNKPPAPQLPPWPHLARQPQFPRNGLLPAGGSPPASLLCSAVMATLGGQEDTPPQVEASPCSTALRLGEPGPGHLPPLTPASASPCPPPQRGAATLQTGLELLAQLSSCPRQGPTASRSQAGRLGCQRKEAAQAGRKEDRKPPRRRRRGSLVPPL